MIPVSVPTVEVYLREVAFHFFINGIRVTSQLLIRKDKKLLIIYAEFKVECSFEVF